MPKPLMELINRRTPNAKHFLNDDGSFTAEIYLGDVHFLNEDDIFENIDTRLFDEAEFDTLNTKVSKEAQPWAAKAKEKKSKGKPTRDDFDYQGLKVPFKAKLPRFFPRGYSMGKGQDTLTFVPVNAKNVKGASEGSKITYADVWESSDVKLELTDRGIKETIILKTDKAPASFSFEVTGNLADDLTAGSLRLQKAWLKDASGTERDVAQTLRKEGTKVYLDLAADVSGLVYPVVIDPTVTTSPAESISKDAYVRSDLPGNNYANSTLCAGNDQAYNYFYSYIQFDISQIPAGAPVVSASLQLYLESYQNASPYDTSIHMVTTTWAEDTVTYNSMPGYAYLQDTKSVPATNTYTSWNIADAVSRWVQGTSVNNGLRISAVYAFGSLRIFSSASTTNITQRPRLDITYNIPPTAPTVTAPNGGETWNTSHIITWTAASDSDWVGQSNNGVSSVNTVNTSGNFTKLAQSFTTPNIPGGVKLGVVKFDCVANVAASSVQIGIALDDGNGYPSTFVYGPTVVTIPYSSGIQTYSFDFGGLSLSPNTRYVFYFFNGSTTNQVAINTAQGLPSGFPTAHALQQYGGSWSLNNGYSLVIQFNFTFSGSLQYQIQLSTDGGTTYSDIVALTSAGATSYTYDFTNKTASTNCKVRIRAYDGTSYGTWDESNAVFTIVHKTKIATLKIQLSSGSLTIPIYDPSVGMTGKNQLRINTPKGVGCFELGATTDPNASPLRVQTAGGVKSILKQ